MVQLRKYSEYSCVFLVNSHILQYVTNFCTNALCHARNGWSPGTRRGKSKQRFSRA